MFFRKLFILVGLFSLLVGFSAHAYSSPGKPTGFVNDYVGLLSAEQKSALETKLDQFAQETSNEIAVAIIDSLGNDETIETYAVKLFEDWGIGSAKNDNGLLFLIAVSDRQMRLEVGYGLEGALPDLTAYQIINNILSPAFKNGEYYSGLNQAIEAAMAATRGEYEPVASSKKLNFLSNLSVDIILFLIFFIFSLLSALHRYLAKSKHWWEGGVIGFVLGLIIALIFFRALMALLISLPFILAAFGFLMDYLVSRVLPQPKDRTGRNGGFWIFPGGRGGSSGGGFGGFGGGFSGGGGASGRW